MRSRWFGLVIAALAVAISIWAYPSLPPRVATHWDLRGTPDGFSSRAWAVALIPIVIVAMTGLFNVLPKLDPRRENYAKFLSSYWLIANAVIVFILVAHGMIITTGLGYSVRIDRLMPLGVGLLFVVLGNYLTRVEPNWFIGIRTPWTLSSDTVWRKTHRTGGWVMVLGGLALASGAFLPGAVLLPLFIGTIVVVAVIPIVQSYVLWKRERHDRA
ncbi:MAG TPA: SdpI family protein [Gemmatimonadales bacterium]|nr:SdpI family protein [Gemmatimonadales bacterium]